MAGYTGVDMLIADVLRGKTAGSALATVTPAATVGELLGLLAQYNVGALPVVDGEQLVGIVSERDVVRQLHERGRTCSTAPSATS